MTTKEFFNSFAVSLNNTLHHGGLFEMSAPVDSKAEPMTSSAPFFHSKVKAGEALLDFGCGTGALTKGLPDDVSYVGIDFSQEMLNLAPPSTANIEFVLDDFHSLPFEDETFDVVVANESLNYANVDKAHKEIYRVLKPSGKFYAKLGLISDGSSFEDFSPEIKNLINRGGGLDVNDSECLGIPKRSDYVAQLGSLFDVDVEIGTEFLPKTNNFFAKCWREDSPQYFPPDSVGYLFPNMNKGQRADTVLKFVQQINFCYGHCVWSSRSLLTCSKKK